MSFLTFIRTKMFLRHTAMAVIFVLLLLWVVFKMLDKYTRHGEVVVVPDFKGMPVEELDAFVADKQVHFEVVDSLYGMDNMKKGVVVKQDPEPKAEVKEGRIVYLYVTAKLPPRVTVPKLVDRSLRQAVSMLETYGLELGEVSYVPDQCMNCILEQKINGRDILPGSQVSKGTKIDLVAGEGLDKKDSHESTDE